MRIDSEAEKLLSLALDIGENMLRSGGEIARVENTLMRICNAYRFKRTDIFSITSLIVVGIETENGEHYTQTRRIYSYNTDLNKLERLNDLSRKICTNTPSAYVIKKELKAINDIKGSSDLSILLGYMLCAGALSVTRDGTLFDGIVSAVIGIFIFIANKFLKKNSLNKIVYTISCSAFAGTLALLFTSFGFGDNPDKIMIGNVMLFIPGIATINSIRDLLCGDIMAGLLRLCEALIIAMSIACGFALPLIISGQI